MQVLPQQRIGLRARAHRRLPRHRAQGGTGRELIFDAETGRLMSDQPMQGLSRCRSVTSASAAGRLRGGSPWRLIAAAARAGQPRRHRQPNCRPGAGIALVALLAGISRWPLPSHGRHPRRGCGPMATGAQVSRTGSAGSGPRPTAGKATREPCSTGSPARSCRDYSSPAAGGAVHNRPSGGSGPGGGHRLDPAMVSGEPGRGQTSWRAGARPSGLGMSAGLEAAGRAA